VKAAAPAVDAEVLQAGVAVAAARGETHAVSKMQELLETLG